VTLYNKYTRALTFQNLCQPFTSTTLAHSVTCFFCMTFLFLQYYFFVSALHLNDINALLSMNNFLGIFFSVALSLNDMRGLRYMTIFFWVFFFR